MNGPEIREKALIGMLVNRPETLSEVLEIVSMSDFFTIKAKTAFSHLIDMWANSREITLPLLASRAPKIAVWLAESVDMGIPTTREIVCLAKEVSDHARAQRIRASLRHVLASDSEDDGPGQIIQSLTDLYMHEIESTSLSKDGSAMSVAKRFYEIIKRNKEMGGHAGLPTGFRFMDELFIEYVPGDIWTIGGFTSSGKTSFMVEMICRLYRQDGNPSVVIISTEMTEEQIFARLLANETGFSARMILTGRITGEGDEKITKLTSLWAERNLTIYDDIYSLDEIKVACKKASMREGGVDVIFIDYVQNCFVPGASSIYQEQSLLAKNLQKLAKNVNGCIICLSQLSNQAAREKSSQLELKGAGEWAAVSDVSIMLGRSDVDESVLFCQIKKNRHGPRHYKDDANMLTYTNNYTSLSEMQTWGM